MNNRKIKAVIFDMDGVITDTMPYHFRAWHKIFLDNGVKVSKFDVYCREGQKGAESIQEIFANAGIEISTAKAKKIITDKEILFKKIVRRRFIPGVRSLLKTLHLLGIRLALVTGTARHEVQHALPSDILTLFEVTVTGTDVKQGKPDPEPYLKALEGLKLRGEEGIVIENAPFGILAAKAAKLKCYAIATSLPVQYLRKADMIFKDFRKLRTVLLRSLEINA